jgi:hypothetical protein
MQKKRSPGAEKASNAPGNRFPPRPFVEGGRPFVDRADFSSKGKGRLSKVRGFRGLRGVILQQKTIKNNAI